MLITFAMAVFRGFHPWPMAIVISLALWGIILQIAGVI
jgi:hypothetical protein